MEHDYLAKGLTATVLTILWIILTNHFFAVYRILLLYNHSAANPINSTKYTPTLIHTHVVLCVNWVHKQ